MEFEKSLFRVYEGTLTSFIPSAEDLLEPDEAEVSASRRPRCRRVGNVQFWKAVEAFLLIVCASCLICLVCLHRSFVGTGQCLQQALAQQHRVSSLVVDREVLANVTSNSTLQDFFKDSNVQGDSFDAPLASDTVLKLTAFPEVDSGEEGTAYAFSCSATSLSFDMTPKLREIYNINTLNVTLPVECLSSSLSWRTFIRNVIGLDTVMVNQAMFAFRCDGLLRNLETSEEWNWSREQFQVYEDTGGLKKYVVRRLRVLFTSLLSFAMISSEVALLVRILISSGVAVMFFLFRFINSFGVFNVQERILNLSYPWLGAQLEMLRTQRRSTVPFLTAHVLFMILFHISYDSMQFLWVLWLQRKTVPRGLVNNLYGLVVICEYFSVVFARSKLTIIFFPRFVLLYFLLFHVYYYLTFYGFSMVALATISAACAHAMVYCLRVHEAKCLQRNLVSFEQPREVYNELPHPQWSMLLPPLYSIFYPLNRQSHSIYDEDEEDTRGVSRFIVRQQDRPSLSTSSTPTEEPNDVVDDVRVTVGPDGMLDAQFAPTPTLSALSRAAPVANEMPRRVDSSSGPAQVVLDDHREDARSAALRAAEARRRTVATNGPPATNTQGSHNFRQTSRASDTPHNHDHLA